MGNAGSAKRKGDRGSPIARVHGCIPAERLDTYPIAIPDLRQARQAASRPRGGYPVREGGEKSK